MFFMSCQRRACDHEHLEVCTARGLEVLAEFRETSGNCAPEGCDRDIALSRSACAEHNSLQRHTSGILAERALQRRRDRGDDRIRIGSSSRAYFLDNRVTEDQPLGESARLRDRLVDLDHMHRNFVEADFYQ